MMLYSDHLLIQMAHIGQAYFFSSVLVVETATIFGARWREFRALVEVVLRLTLIIDIALSDCNWLWTLSLTWRCHAQLLEHFFLLGWLLLNLLLLGSYLLLLQVWSIRCGGLWLMDMLLAPGPWSRCMI